MTRAPLALLLFPFFASFPPPASAARPLITDDARVVDPGGCQVESYVKRQTEFREHEFWFLPGCSPVPRVELTAGGQRTDRAAEGRFSTVLVQAKTLLSRLERDGLGWAAALGAQRQNDFVTTERARWSPFLNLIASYSFGDAAFLHVNAGAHRERPAHSTRHTWGLGVEIPIGSGYSAIAEAYGEQQARPNRQLGVRYWIAPDRLQIDGALGAQSDVPQKRTWVSVGLRALF